MKKICWPLALIALLIASCTNADPKKMASAVCDCFQSKKKISSKTKKIILKASKSDDFRTELQTELQNIDDADEKQKVTDEITAISETFSDEKTQDCATAVDKKYRVMKSDSVAIQKKMVDEMGNIDDCEVYAAFVKVGLKQKNKKHTDDDTTTDDETDQPKKKKTSDE